MKNELCSKIGLMLMTALLVSVSPALSQSAQSTSTIIGVIKDTSGAVVPDATITVTNADTAQTRTVMSAGDGAYLLPALPAGHYTVKVEKSGFKTETQEHLTLDVAQTLTVNMNLEVGLATQEVVVNEQAPLVNTTTSSLGGLVNDQQMAELPLNGRNYIDLSLMQPGVQQNKAGGFGGMGGTVASSNGAPVTSNSYLLDGTSVVNQSGWSTASMAGTTLGVDGIKEFKVITNSFSAEYGMSMGSQMVMVSKGGSNQFHGDGFDYLRNSILDARNYFDPAHIPPFRRNNFGGSVGGPIKRNKTFFYAVYEGLRQDAGFTVGDQVPSANCHGPAGTVVWNGTGSRPAEAIGPCTQLGNNPSGPNTNTVTINPVTAPLLTLYPTPTNSTNNTFTFPTPTITGVNFGQIRVDQNVSTSDTIFGRYTLDKSDVDSASNSAFTSPFSGVAFPQFRATAWSWDQFVTLSENHIFSSTLLNTARLSFSRTHFGFGTDYTTPLSGIPSFIAGEPFGTLVVGGISTMGEATNAGPPSPSHLQNIYTFGDDLYYARGKHALKFGVLINRYNEGFSSASLTAGEASYAGLASFLRGIPSTYTAETPGSNQVRDYIYNTFGLYAQDDWRVASRLTLNVGLRYEFFTTPYELDGLEYGLRGINQAPTPGPFMQNKSLLNFSPRLGFAWDIFGDGRTSLRGGFGVYYDILNIGDGMTEETAAPPLVTTSLVSNQAGNAVVPFPLVFTPGQVGHSIQGLIDYHANQPHLLQYNLTAERQLPGNMSLSVGYVGTRGVHLWGAKEGNPTIPTAIVNGVEYWSSLTATCASAVPSCRVNPIITSEQLATTFGDSWYNALQVILNKRLGSGLEFEAAYTYAHSLDETQGNLAGGACTSSGMNPGFDPNFPRNELGPSCFDVRHNLRFNLLYHFPRIQTNSFVSKIVNGWWMGNIVSVQTGYPFTPVLGTNRSFSNTLSLTSSANVGTATVAPGQVGPGGQANTTNQTFIPFNSGAVITGNPNQWFNPLMFALQPMVPCPTQSTLTCGTLGDASRGLLRGPGLGEWDFSIVKDTALPLLGEQGSLQFRAEFFNFLNRTNFGQPSGTVFAGSTADIGAYSEAPTASAGQITTTATTSRQIQFALKLIF